MVRSFGRVDEPAPAQAEEPLPMMVLPAVQIPAMLVLDPESMRDVVDQIREQVAAAVRAGFAQALGEHDPEAAAVFTAAGADPAPEQLAGLVH